MVQNFFESGSPKSLCDMKGIRIYVCHFVIAAIKVYPELLGQWLCAFTTLFATTPLPPSKKKEIPGIFPSPRVYKESHETLEL